MTRKDYVKMAEAIKTVRKTSVMDALLVSRVFSEVAIQDNPRFDKDRFMEACGLKVETPKAS